MKNYVIPIMILLLTLVSCKKETTSIPNPSDSLLTGDSIVIKPTYDPKAFTVDQVDEENGKGMTIFKKSGKNIIAIDNQGQQGLIKLNGLEIPLTEINFTENNYYLKGNNVEVVAENGNFEEMVSDCSYGQFKTITIIYNKFSTTLSDVSVQYCPSY